MSDASCESHIRGNIVIAFFRSVGIELAGMVSCNLTYMLIISVNDSYLTLLKQQALTVNIIFKVLMLIGSDVVRLNVCEDSKVKDKALGSVKHESLAGYLHYHGIDSFFHHLLKVFLKKI